MKARVRMDARKRSQPKPSWDQAMDRYLGEEITLDRVHSSKPWWQGETWWWSREMLIFGWEVFYKSL